MNIYRPLLSILLISQTFLFGCFGSDLRGGILRYDQSEVRSGLTRFSVGKLPPGWRSQLVLKQLVFTNDDLKATLLVDALCGPKFQDGPLKRLAEDFFVQVKDKKIGEERYFSLDGREAVNLEGVGSVDGVPVKMSVVVVKKNFCLYDFVYFAPRADFHKGLKDFETLYHGFRTH